MPCNAFDSINKSVILKIFVCFYKRLFPTLSHSQLVHGAMANILLAEDDESMLNFLTLALERAGHHVVSKRNGQEALDAFKAGESYDLLLTDIVMPGLDGVELAQRVSDLAPHTRVMFITGFAAMAMKAAGDIEEQKPKVLSKPFHLNDLVQQVERLLAA